MSLVLVVDDDSALQRTIRINLRARDHEVLAVASGRSALAAFLQRHPDLVILDLGLPDMDGLSVLRALRRRSEVPIIVLSARQAADDKVEALDEGADDYVTKPFSMGELMARVRRALRRSERGGDVPPNLAGDDLALDFAEHVAARAGEVIHLTPIEWRLLTELARADGAVVPHEELLRAVWGPGYEQESHYLRVFASQIRHKIEADPAQPRHLVNEPGFGYRLLP